MSLPASFDLTAEDAKLLLAANVHLGAKNVQVCTKSHLIWCVWYTRLGWKIFDQIY